MSQTLGDALRAVAELIDEDGINLGFPYSQDGWKLRDAVQEVCYDKGDTVLAEPGELWWTNTVHAEASSVIEFGDPSDTIATNLRTHAEECDRRDETEN